MDFKILKGGGVNPVPQTSPFFTGTRNMLFLSVI